MNKHIARATAYYNGILQYIGSIRVVEGGGEGIKQNKKPSPPPQNATRKRQCHRLRRLSIVTHN